MQFSHRLALAVHLLACVAENAGKEKTTSNFLAERLDVNPVAVRQVLGRLKEAGLVAVESGVGGTSLLRKPKDISLWDVFRAVENADQPLFALHGSAENAGAEGRLARDVIASRLKDVQKDFERGLKDITLKNVIKDMRRRTADLDGPAEETKADGV